MKKFIIAIVICLGLVLPAATNAATVCICHFEEEQITPDNVSVDMKNTNKCYPNIDRPTCITHNSPTDSIKCYFEDRGNLDPTKYCNEWNSYWNNKIDTLLLSASNYNSTWRASSSKFIPQCLLEDELSQECRDINIFLVFGINIARYVFGIVGALALLMFIYGGFTLILSRGSSEKVKKGGEIMIAAVIGLVIVFGAYLLVSYFSSVLGVRESITLPQV